MATEINAFIPEDSSPILISYINSIATIKRAEVVEITLLPSIPYYRVLGRVVRKLRISILKEALLIFSQHHPHVTIITSDTVVKDIDSPEEKVTARPSDLLYEKAYDGLLGLSTYSTLVTEYSRSEMAPPRRWKKIAEDIRENFLHSYLDTKN